MNSWRPYRVQLAIIATTAVTKALERDEQHDARTMEESQAEADAEAEAESRAKGKKTEGNLPPLRMSPMDFNVTESVTFGAIRREKRVGR